MSIGEKLRALRGSKSQTEIAGLLHISKSAWAMYERNERVPRDELKISLQSFLEKQFRNYFFNRKITIRD